MSVLSMIPSISVVILIFSISSETDLMNSGRRFSEGTAYSGAPARVSSRLGAAIFIPAAAETWSTEVNLSRGSLISSRGLGKRAARTLVMMGFSLAPTMMVSPFFSIPS